ncbi:MAG: phospholipase D-like domain-containing protein [Acidobacteriota bacterium]
MTRRTHAWTAVVLLIVGIPLVLFALVGVPHLFRGSLVRNVIAREPGGEPAGVASAHFAPAFALLTGTSLTAGNAVEVLANGDATFPRLWSDLRSARRSVTVQMYYAGPGAVADTSTRILAERARAGVDVYFLYDAFGAQDLPQSYLDTLRAAGVHVAQFRPVRWYALDRASHRSHVRGIVVDGGVAYTGGFGFADKWLGGGRRPGEWRETNARFAGPAVSQLQAAFIAKWAEATGELLTGERFLPFDDAAALTSAGATEAALVYSPPLTGSTTAERLFALSIASAQRRLYIANAYFVPDADFVQLVGAAARRGVDVRVLTNSARSDVKTTWLAGRSRYETLLAAGVRIYEYRPTTIHCKTFVVDGAWSAVGTMNFDNRSLAYNSEVALVALDTAVAANLESLFLEDLRFADEIRLDDFRRRPRTQRFLERAASVLASLM